MNISTVAKPNENPVAALSDDAGPTTTSHPQLSKGPYGEPRGKPRVVHAVHPTALIDALLARNDIGDSSAPPVQYTIEDPTEYLISGVPQSPIRG